MATPAVVSAAARVSQPWSAGGRGLLDADDSAGSYGSPDAGPLYNFDGFELEPVLPLPEETLAQAIPVDFSVGFATGKINPDRPGSVAYYLTNGVYFALALVTEEGVVLVDAPQPMAATLVPAVKQVAGEDAQVTHMVYSHAHQDHISGASAVVEAFPDVEIIADEEALEVLTEKADPARPLPTTTFRGNYTLTVGGVAIELSEAPAAHTTADLFVFVPSERLAMIVDVVFPGWTPFRSVAIAGNPGKLVAVHDAFLAFDADTFLCGHLTRLGSRADVELSREFHVELFEAAAESLAAVDAAAIAPEALAAGHLWLYTSQLGRTHADTCYQLLKPKWTELVAGFDVYGRSHCLTATDFLRID